MKNKGNILLIVIIAFMLAIGAVEHFKHQERIQTLEKQFNAYVGQYNCLNDEVGMLRKEAAVNEDLIHLVNFNLSDYINKHQFSHDLDVVLNKAELQLMVEEIVMKYTESED